MKGRPTDDPKTLNTRIRLSQNDMDKLEYCCNQTGKKKSEIERTVTRQIRSRKNGEEE